MSDPIHGEPADKDDGNLDKKNAAEASPGDESGDSTDSTLRKDSSITAGATPRQGLRNESRDLAAEAPLAKLDITFGFPGMTGQIGGQMSYLQLRKGDDKAPDSEKKPTSIQPLIKEFLKNTDLSSSSSLTAAEVRQLAFSRESLSNATNIHDAVSDSLHLARLYQHMRYIEEAKKAVDFSLGIDPHNYYGRELFRELERMHSTEIGSAASVSPTPISKSNLRKRILSMTGGKVIVLGDLLIDELLEGKPERISREAPVLVLEHVDTELIPGGASNTANNIAALGGQCHAIGVCGEDHYAQQLEQLFEKVHIAHSLVRDPSRPTTVKTRILSKSHSFKQQLLRLDRISHNKIDEATENKVLAKLKAAAGEFKALILSDYRAGVMTDGLIRPCRAIAAENNMLLVVDAQDDFTRYQDVSLLTPNQPDAEKALGYAMDNPKNLEKAGKDLLMMTGAKALLITRGAEGMVLFRPGEQMVLMPTFNRSEVFDVTGAGDTVVATMTLALVTGSSHIEAMALGNLAAGLVVKKPGTAVTSQKEMLESLDMLKLEE